jgi:hypothetical protein
MSEEEEEKKSKFVTVSDAGLFVCKDYKEIIIAIVYVDNAMFFGKNKAQVDYKKKLFMDK